MIKRHLEGSIKKYLSEYPVIAIVGPRQSGKTTLVRAMFPKYRYLSLENIDLRKQAEDDPRGFFNDYGNYLILDEVQRVPHLFSYLQQLVDDDSHGGQYILTGSNQFLLMENIVQTLAGRIITFKLYPFNLQELFGKKRNNCIDDVFLVSEKGITKTRPDLLNLMFSGMYPRIHDKHLTPRKWLENYVFTYVERDVRSLINLTNLKQFEDLLKLCASYSGQLLNYAAISNAIGISEPTVKKWISVLETSGIIFILQPYHRNFKKRIVKTPKLFFVDTGLLCFLLSIRSTQELKHHPLYGSIFETFIISELYKRISHMGEIPPIYFWRDKTGNEIDCLVELGQKLIPIEIKSSQTYSDDFTKSINRWLGLSGNQAKNGLIIYDGKDIIGKNSLITTIPWWKL